MASGHTEVEMVSQRDECDKRDIEESPGTSVTSAVQSGADRQDVAQVVLATLVEQEEAALPAQKRGCDRGRALCCLSADNVFRKKIIAFETSAFFDNFILGTIIVNTVCMAMSSPKDYPEKTEVHKVMVIMDLIACFIFTFEMVIHVIARGFIIGPDSYLSQGNFKFDFVVVCLSLVELFEVEGMPNLKPLRAFRALRALKVFKYLTYCTAILEALSNALGMFGDIVAVTVFLMVIFGVMGVQIFAGAMRRQCKWKGDGEGLAYERYCDSDVYKGVFNQVKKTYEPNQVAQGFTCPHGSECVTGDNPNDGWVSFDNMYMAVFSIFQIITLEGWTPLMYALQDTVSPPSWIYMVTMVVLLGFLVVSLYCSVIIMSFGEMQKKADKESDQKANGNRLALTIEQQIAAYERNNPTDYVTVEPDSPSVKQGMSSTVPGSGSGSGSAISDFKTSTNPLVTRIDTVGDSTIPGSGCGSGTGQPEEEVDEGLKDLEMELHGDQPEEEVDEGLKDLEMELQDGDEYNAEQPASSMDEEIKNALQHGDEVEEEEEEEDMMMSPEDMENMMASPDDEEVYKSKEAPEDSSGFSDEYIETHLGGETAEVWLERVTAKFPGVPLCIFRMWRRGDPLPDETNPDVPHSPRRFDTFIGRIISSVPFDTVITTVIAFNAITMGMEYNEISRTEEDILELLEVVFSLVFMVEMVLKLTTYQGFYWYFGQGSDVFDFILVSSSVPSVMSYLFGTSSGVNLSLLRVFKLFRLFRLLRQMKDLIDTVVSAMSAISNLVVFIIFAITICSIFSMSLFSLKLFDEDGEVPRSNFDTFGSSFVTLFQVMTGEDWTDILYNAMRCAPDPDLYNGTIGEWPCSGDRSNAGGATGFIEMFLAVAFVCGYFIFASYVMLEMFTATILQNFELETQEKNDLQLRLYTAKMAAQKMKDSLLGSTKSSEEDPLLGDSSGDNTESDRTAAYGEAGSGSVDNVIAKALSGEEPPPEAPSLSDSPDFVSKSCFLFSTSNKFRGICLQISNSCFMENMVLLCIAYSSVLLAMDSPHQPDPFFQEVIMPWSDLILLVIFLTEMSLKLVAYGFKGAPTAYISDAWNKIDFFVICISVIGMFVSVLPDAIGRILRLGRTIRPLRMVNKSERVQIIFGALQRSLPAIAGVCILAGFFMFIFSVIGMTFFMGLFYTCNNEDAAGKADCFGIITGDWAMPMVWANPDYSFDNVFASMLCIFEASSLEGWVDMMHSGMDVTSKDMMPVQDASWGYVVFFILAIFICALFLLNMVVGVIIEKFNQMSGRGMLTEPQRAYKDMMIGMMTHEVEPPAKKVEGCRRKVLDVLQNPKFDTFILGLIFINAMVMAAEHYGQSQEWTELLDLLNQIFVWIFLAELIVRMYGMGPPAYFKDAWNVLDFFIVIGCLAVLFLDSTGIPLQAARPIRLLQIFRMIRRCPGLRLMVGTLLISLPALFNVSCLLFLVIFIWAIIGMQLFANVRYGNVLGPHVNFQTFGPAMLLLVRCITGENWNVIMHDCMVEFPQCTNYAEKLNGYWLPNDCGSAPAALLYFLSFYAIGIFTIMNLFVAVVLDNFQFFQNTENAAISKKAFEDFEKIWFEFTMKDKDMASHRGLFLKLHCIQDFVLRLGSPLGVDNLLDYESQKLVKFMIAECRIKCVVLPKVPPMVGGPTAAISPLTMGTFDLRSFNNEQDETEKVPLTPRANGSNGPSNVSFSGAVLAAVGSETNKQPKKQQLPPGEVPTTFEAVGFKQLQFILALYASGMEPLPYEDRVNREKELADIALSRSATLIQSTLRVKLVKMRQAKLDHKVQQKLAGDDVTSNMFARRFADVVHDEVAQKKMGLIAAEDITIERQDLNPLLFEEAQHTQVQDPEADIKKISGVFAEVVHVSGCHACCLCLY